MPFNLLLDILVVVYAPAYEVDFLTHLMIGILITWILLDDRLAGETLGGR